MIPSITSRKPTVKVLLASALCAMLAACERNHVYEFSSCESRDSKVINVMYVPRGFQSSTSGDKLIRDDEPVSWLEKDPKGPGSFYRNSGLHSTYLYTTYPDYKALGSTSWKDYSEKERLLGDKEKLLFAIVKFSYGKVMSRDDTWFIHDQKGIRKNEIVRIREESFEEGYWAYPPYDQRISKSTGRPTYFMPKDTDINVRIACPDIGENRFPKNGHCFIESNFVGDKSLDCKHVEYRIAAKDMPNWREFDTRVKQQIKSMITQRTHGYTAPTGKGDK